MGACGRAVNGRAIVAAVDGGGGGGRRWRAAVAAAAADRNVAWRGVAWRGVAKRGVAWRRHLVKEDTLELRGAGFGLDQLPLHHTPHLDARGAARAGKLGALHVCEGRHIRPLRCSDCVAFRRVAPVTGDERRLRCQ